MARRRSKPLKRRAWLALQEAADSLGPGVEVGRLTYLGEGLSRFTWTAELTTPDGRRLDWVLQVPRPKATDDDRARFARELHLLEELQTLDLPFGFPHPIGAFEVDDVVVNVTTRCAGAEIDMKGRYWTAEDGAQRIGELAAQVHRIPIPDIDLPGERFESQRTDAESSLSHLRAVDPPFLDEILAFCTEHLPPVDARGVFLHGDLLGQNVRVLHNGPTSLLDWEFAGVGDPALDLAIVTRGERTVFGSPRGTRMLLDIYNEHADVPIPLSVLRVREITLVAGEAETFIEDYPDARDEEIGRLRGVYRRALKDRD